MFYMSFFKLFSDLKIFFQKMHFLALWGPFFENQLLTLLFFTWPPKYSIRYEWPGLVVSSYTQTSLANVGPWAGTPRTGTAVYASYWVSSWHFWLWLCRGGLLLRKGRSLNLVQLCMGKPHNKCNVPNISIHPWCRGRLATLRLPDVGYTFFLWNKCKSIHASILKVSIVLLTRDQN